MAHLQIDERSKFYLFDWDDNVIKMPTSVCMDELSANGEWVPRQLSTLEYATARAHLDRFRPPGGDWQRAYVEFGDVGPRGDAAFVDDLERALDSLEAGTTKTAPSFHKFKTALIEGRLFAVVTARGHSSATLRRGVEYFVDRVFTDEEKRSMIANLRHYRTYFDSHKPDEEADDVVLREYFDYNRFYGVSHDEFVKRVNSRNGIASGPIAVEDGKKIAIREFVRHVVDVLKSRDKLDQLAVSVGFSDDDKRNIAVAQQLLAEELGVEFPNIRFVCYDTSVGEEKKIVLTPGSPVKKVIAVRPLERAFD